MAAVILDDEFESEEGDTQNLEASPEVAEAEPPEDDMPEKYRGKTPQELAAMHQETERFIGRQANEMGELRKAVDKLLEADLKKDTPEETPVDFFDDPDKAVEPRIANHPAIKAANETARKVEQRDTQARLMQKHPDITDVIADPTFTEWVGKSKLRQQLFKSGSDYDFDAADELLTLFKERRGVAQQTAVVEGQQRSQAIKDASTGSPRGSGGTPAKTLPRGDMNKPRKYDPQR